MKPTPKVRLLLSIIVIVTAGSYIAYKMPNSLTAQEPSYPLTNVLFVSDWEITQIYGPGTAQQQRIVEQFQALGITSFNSPVLYRAGGKNTANGQEGLILAPFDPQNPKSALKLKAQPITEGQ